MKNKVRLHSDRTPAFYASMILDGLLIFHFLWLFVFMSAPVVEFFMKSGFPQNPEVWNPLGPLLMITIAPFAAAAVIALAMERLWQGRSSGIVLQIFVCTVVTVHFPLGTAAGFACLALIGMDVLAGRGLGCERRRDVLGLTAGLAAGLLAVFFLYVTQTLWLIDLWGD